MKMTVKKTNYGLYYGDWEDDLVPISGVNPIIFKDDLFKFFSRNWQLAVNKVVELKLAGHDFVEGEIIEF